ncbi:MAG: hypothetical protein HZA22_10840 [Nitrospirae bacterium]|nr:hypothetical protein [Nitrospirota bacterium]MBI5696140.1 hypothetical protein [Nitrospirota bacterium]
MTLREFIDRHGQKAFNLYLFVNLAGWLGYQAYTAWREGRFDYIEAAFTLQNLVMVVLILVRKDHITVDRNVLHQGVALAAFFSGVFFTGAAESTGEAALTVSKTVIMTANVLGLISLINLGRSFGILIAYREVRRTGLYSVVRHPMYGTDILLRAGYLISHPAPAVFALFVISSAAYVYRAVLEERFLVTKSGYREYMSDVRYRFIPYIY